MSSNTHQRVKYAFEELLRTPREQWEARLQSLSEQSAEVAEEVRSLLSYHTDDSLITGRQPTWRWKQRWLQAYASPCFAFFLGVLIGVVLVVGVAWLFNWSLPGGSAANGMSLGLASSPSQTASGVAGLSSVTTWRLIAFAILGLSLFAMGWLFYRRCRLPNESERIGPYRIQSVLGEGGMGRVYEARHEWLGRRAAVKVLADTTPTQDIVERFEREVQLASKLCHPNTITIYDYGRRRSGGFYYAMEYIEGAHLGQLVEFAGPLLPGRCIYLLSQLCRALKEAHNAGVVHRDIKPQNVMVCNCGGEPDFVKLFDYGLVKSFASEVAQNSTQTTVVVGTPRFMAPERLTSPWLADPRVDVYSVGALAYYLITGQLPPVVHGEEMEGDWQPGIETLDLPADVVAFGELLGRCMAIQPAARPDGMSELLHELHRLDSDYGWTREQSENWWRKHGQALHGFVDAKREGGAGPSPREADTVHG